jgi:hypothetical protein
MLRPTEWGWLMRDWGGERPLVGCDRRWGERPFADCAERWAERPLKSTLIVMTTYGKNINIVIIKLVDESVFLRDTP